MTWTPAHSTAGRGRRPRSSGAGEGRVEPSRLRLSPCELPARPCPRPRPRPASSPLALALAGCGPAAPRDAGSSGVREPRPARPASAVRPDPDPATSLDVQDPVGHDPGPVRDARHEEQLDRRPGPHGQRGLLRHRQVHRPCRSPPSRRRSCGRSPTQTRHLRGDERRSARPATGSPSSPRRRPASPRRTRVQFPVSADELDARRGCQGARHEDTDPGRRRWRREAALDRRHAGPVFYQVSVHDALAAHKPFVLVFATPAFCTSRVCGPTLDTSRPSPGRSRA